MQQLEIKFFFPLTEQIPLDLDYTDCGRPTLTLSSVGMTAGTGITFTTPANNPWATVSISGSQLNLDVEEIEFKLKQTPSLMRRIMYKVMGLKWKVK